MFVQHEEVDAFSEILEAVRLHGDTVARFAPATPFAVTIPSGVRLLHIVQRGPVHLTVGDAAPILLGSGDLVLLGRGDAHTLTSGTDATVRPLSESDTFRCDDELPDPDAPHWVTGIFAVEEAIAEPLLAVLPRAIHIPADPSHRPWLAAILPVLLIEITHPNPGAAAMVSRVLDLLFIHTLRAFFDGNNAEPGWLTAAMDPALGPVLAAIHRDPDQPWTVTTLARNARMSRSAFAERFTRLLGRAPAAYVTERRLDHAADLLRSTNDPVSRIASDVGYTSNAAFSRAFQRRYGDSPQRWRKLAAR